VLTQKQQPGFGAQEAEFLYIYFLNHFAKLYDRLFFLIWQPTAVRHGG
jgi:hypothetical protein